jgi:homoserine O-succinyltransferase
MVDGSQVPTRWLEKKPAGRIVSIDSRRARAECLRIALINNMPDAALEDTELQFFDLLDSASGDLPVFVKLYSLTGVPRSDRGMRHLNSFYYELDDLWISQFDALIMTGTEPRQPNLRQEPYWAVLANVLDWAERNTVSTVLSCLAAHAGVLHSDGIERHRLSDKQFGVFGFSKTGDHALTNRTAQIVRFPHSRWNEVRSDDLKSCGYTVLTQDADAGVDSFVKRKRRSLFVHFQGHPEYGEHTLLKEYRRDIRRFVCGERETYPTMPRGYFSAEVTKILSDFQQRALSNPGEEVMAAFPDGAVGGGLHNNWRSSAACIYGNWLQYVMSRKAEISTFPVLSETYSGVYNDAPRKRSVLP